MKASYYLGDGKFELREQKLREPGPDEVLVRNAVCGVCGTDVHIYHGEPGSAEVAPPVVLGHEYSGVVEKAGADVRHVRVGDHVTIDPNIYCGVCRYCREGKKQMCENMVAVGVTQDGGFAEYSLLPASAVLKTADDLDFSAAAMAEPLACCVHGIDLAEIRPGQDVLIIGGGAIGLLNLQLAKLSGAARVILSEPVAFRREVAKELGADFCIDPTAEAPEKQLERLIGRSGVDVVIECVGRTVATRQSFDCADKGATIVLFSVPSVGATFELPLFDVFKKELTIRGSFVNPDTHSRAVALLNAGKIQTAPLITHRYGLDQVEEAIKMQMSAESIKVVVEAR